MDNKEEFIYEKEDLYIPINVRKRFEIATGIGKKEIGIIICYAIAGVPIAFLVYLFLLHELTIFAVAPIATGAIAVLLHSKSKVTQLSMWDDICAIVRLYKNQSVYLYEKIGSERNETEKSNKRHR